MDLTKGLLGLPPEIIEHVAGFLRYKELVRLALTSREAQRLYWDIEKRLKVSASSCQPSVRPHAGFDQDAPP